jgi:hypothetical protein
MYTLPNSFGILFFLLQAQLRARVSLAAMAEHQLILDQQAVCASCTPYQPPPCMFLCSFELLPRMQAVSSMPFITNITRPKGARNSFLQLGSSALAGLAVTELNQATDGHGPCP